MAGPLESSELDPTTRRSINNGLKQAVAADAVLTTAYVAADVVVAANAAAALTAHDIDTTSVHGIADTSALYRVGGTDVAIADGGTGASTAATGFANLKQDATATATGVVELATDAETTTGTDTTRAVTPANLTAQVLDTAVIYKSANESITNNTWTIPTYNSESVDSNGMHSTSTNTARITAIRAGSYMVHGIARFAANATGQRNSYITKNSAGVPAGGTVVGSDEKPGHGTLATYCVWTGIVALAANDYLEQHVYQNSGGALNLLGGLGNTTLNMYRIGA